MHFSPLFFPPRYYQLFKAHRDVQYYSYTTFYREPLSQSEVQSPLNFMNSSILPVQVSSGIYRICSIKAIRLPVSPIAIRGNRKRNTAEYV